MHVESKVTALYTEVDVVRPTLAFPIAPLGPLLERLKVRCDERPKLTLRSAEEFLRQRQVIRGPLIASADTSVDKLSGFIYSDGRIARILVNADEIITRRRFSLGHELGHFILHCRPQAVTLATGGPFVDTLDLDAPGHGLREKEADAFAAALLMPEDVVRAVSDAALKRGWRRDDVWRVVAETLLVSYEAARRRVSELGVAS